MSHHILIVDDSPTHRSLLQVFLSGSAFKFSEANHGKEALSLLAGGNELPDLIIADINMPEMDGLTFLEHLRNHADRRLRRIPLILLTGDNRSLEEKATSADAFLRKPVSSAGVLEAVSQLLGLPG